MDNVNDITGFQTLNILSEADRFNKWMYDSIKKYAKGSVLEIGSGIGNISFHILSHFNHVYLTDYDADYCELLRKKFGSNKNLKGISQMDLVDPEFDQKFGFLFNSFDTIIALNVIEHIKDDNLAIRNCKKLLRQQGNLIMLVPAYQWLYNKFDTNLGHFRRYNRTTIKNLVNAELRIISIYNFNAVAIPGWFISGRVLGKETIPSGQVKLVERIVPVMKMADRLLRNSVGLSVIAIGEKA